MKSLGIIAEFNPFHEGHKYLIDRAMSETGSDVCVAVMSGSFVQRGGPAVADKWTRTMQSIKGGVNLVIELPAVFATASAELFSFGGVKTLEALGCIDTLAFGSESGNLDELKRIAAALKENDVALMTSIRQFCKEGMSFPKAREKALEESYEYFSSETLRSPNNILAIEYLKHLERMEPFTVKRVGAGHHQSASEIRRKLESENPDRFSEMADRYFTLVRGAVLTHDSETLESLSPAGQGLGNKLKAEIRYANDLESIIERVKSKSVTYSGISRYLANIVLNKELNYEATPEYIRILGFDKTGAEFLKQMKRKKSCSLPVITNINKDRIETVEGRKMLDLDTTATDIHNLVWGNDMYSMSDYVHKPILY
ncbi:MAG: nucleotidyltransferase family protein [Eubacteriaceae bacterium]|nr:nucleotidyltransferase family protein [Eubacteriaceae bacterium]